MVPNGVGYKHISHHAAAESGFVRDSTILGDVSYNYSYPNPQCRLQLDCRTLKVALLSLELARVTIIKLRWNN